MITKKLKQFIKSLTATDKPENIPLSADQLHLACAALLLEVATIDQHLDERELAKLQLLLIEQFNLEKSDLDELMVNAKQQKDQSSSLYEFTHIVNTQCDYQAKMDLVEGLWKIAYADGNLDKYEEYMVRRISELIYVNHGDFIKTKHQARPKD